MSRRYAAIDDEERKAGARVVFSLLVLGLGAIEAFHDLVRRASGDGPSVAGALHVALLLVAAAAVWVRRDVAWIGVLPPLASCAVHGLAAAREGSARGPLLLAATPVLLLLAWQGRRPVQLLRVAGPRLLRALRTVARHAGR